MISAAGCFNDYEEAICDSDVTISGNMNIIRFTIFVAKGAVDNCHIPSTNVYGISTLTAVSCYGIVNKVAV